ncbi:hypothetical protein EAF04_001373 [Stromatinia cepivora]|nr:hypothetical protein EAF04_001373 [Stromatinia cepivora]
MITNNLYNILYKRLNKITNEMVIIQANLYYWVGTGFIYNKICTAFDKGALFLILWEDSKLLKGIDFDEVMIHFKSIGIMELSKQFGADVLISQILDSVLELFRWEVIDIIAVAANLNIKSKPFSGGPSARGPSVWGSSAGALSIRGLSVKDPFTMVSFVKGPFVKGLSVKGPSARGPSINIQFAGSSSTGGSSAESRPIGASPFIEARPSGIKPVSISSILNPSEAVRSYNKAEGSDILVKLETDNKKGGIDSLLKLYNSGEKRKRVDSIIVSDPKTDWILSQSASKRRSLVGLCPVDRNRMESILGKRFINGIIRSRKRFRDDNH